MTRPLPLEDKHRAAGARFCERWGWTVPCAYDGAEDEAAQLRDGVGLCDVSYHSRIYVYGEDAADLLGSLLTIPADELEESRCARGLLLDEEGRIVEVLNVCRLGPERFLLDGGPANATTLPALLQSAVPAGHDVRVDDRQARTALLAVEGPRAPELLSSAVAQLLPPRLGQDANVEFEFIGYKALAYRCGNLTSQGAFLLVAPMVALHLWDQLVAAGAQPIGLEALTSARRTASLLETEDVAGQTPRQAGLEHLIVPEGRSFRGKDALA